jgi:hypothetical protein
MEGCHTAGSPVVAAKNARHVPSLNSTMKPDNVLNTDPLACTRSSQALTCWICMGDNNDEPLTRDYCRCSGTMGHVHRSCLEQYVVSANLQACRTCHRPYSWATVSTPDTPLFPETTSRCVAMILQFFLLPYARHVSITFLAAIVKYVTLPLLLGLYWAPSGVKLDVSFERTTDSAAPQPLWPCFLAGVLLSVVARGMSRMHCDFYEKANAAAVANTVNPATPRPTATHVEPSAARRPTVTGFDLLQSVAKSTRSWVAPEAGPREFGVNILRDAVVAAALCTVLNAPITAAGAILAAAACCRLCAASMIPRAAETQRSHRRDGVPPNQVDSRIQKLSVHVKFFKRMLDIFFANVTMPAATGLALHYASEPYLHSIPSATACSRWSPETAMLCWACGYATLAAVRAVERRAVTPLFGRGPAAQDSICATQAIRGDPLSSIAAAAKAHVMVIPALLLFVRVTLCVINVARDALTPLSLDVWIYGGEAAAAQRLPLPLVSGVATVAALELYALVTAACCFEQFPVQHCALRVLVPITKAISRWMPGLDWQSSERFKVLEAWNSNHATAKEATAELEALLAALPAVPPSHDNARSAAPFTHTLCRVAFACCTLTACLGVPVMLFILGSLVTSPLATTTIRFGTLPIAGAFAVWDPSRFAAAALKAAMLAFTVPAMCVHNLSDVLLTLDWSCFAEDVFVQKYGITRHLTPQPPSFVYSRPCSPPRSYSRQISGMRPTTSEHGFAHDLQLEFPVTQSRSASPRFASLRATASLGRGDGTSQTVSLGAASPASLIADDGTFSDFSEMDEDPFGR